MNDQETIVNILNVYRDDIKNQCPKSLSIWQANCTVMPVGVSSLFRLAKPFPMVVKRAKGARIWDAATGARLKEASEHSQQVQCLVFTLDGTRLVSGSQDGTILIWGILDSASP